MPITITLPPGATDPLLGPGVGYGVRSDFIGPLPQGSYFDFRVARDAEGLQECFGWVVFVSGVQFSGNVLADPSASYELGNQHILQDGERGRLLVTLHSPTSTLDSGAEWVTWDETVGVGQQIMLKPTAGAQGGFTAEDRANLTDVEEATTEPVQSQLNPVVTHVLNGLDLLTWFPVNRLSAAECRTLTQRGSLNRDQLGLQVAAMGFRWRILTVPPSFGVRDGALQEYIERVAQFVKINADNSGELYVDEVVDVFWSLGKLSWSWNNFPHQVLYDITPGCSVEFCWLLL